METIPPDLDPHTCTANEMLDFYRHLHSNGCPVPHSSAHGGFFTVSSHPQLRTAARDWKTFSSAGGITLPKLPLKNLALEEDPPAHGRSRAILHEVLGVDTVRAAEPAVRQNAASLIEAFAGRGNAELVSELAEIVPGNTICRIIGVTDPERIRFACRLGIRLAESSTDPNAGATLGEFARFCAEEIEVRRQHPRADFLTRLATGETGDHPLTDDEIVGLLLGFFFAGHHTTTAGLAALFYHIATDAALRDELLADRSLIRGAVEEAVRLETPLHGSFRQATQDTKIEDTPIPAGSEVWLNFAAGNRDPTVFEAPEEFKVNRQPNPHLGFGHGIHTCVGAALSRMEMRVVTEELLARIPDLSTTGEPLEYRWSAGNVMSIARVPIIFTPRP